MRVGVRRLVVLIWSFAMGWAAPPLTTIQDVLYKADGTPFSGILVVEWKSFEAADTSNVATQSLTTPILNGVLRVQLVPTTNASPGASYLAKYSSDGRVQFQETWQVPPSLTPLRVRDVRIASSGSGTLPPSGDTTPVQESDVVGLLADLAARPVKGPGYAPSRAVYATAAGALEAVVGDLADCVRVDGSAGPCGASSGPVFVDAETPAGLINGSNTVFTLADAPSPPASLTVYRNGLLQTRSLDYTLSGNVITFAGASTPQGGDVLAASYRLADPGDPQGLAGGALTRARLDPTPGMGLVSEGDQRFNNSRKARNTVEAAQTHTLPQVLCGSAGASTSSTGLTRLGSCTVPENLLSAGDRVEIRFDYSHEGAGTGFSFEVRWGGSVLVSRGAGATEAMVSGKAGAAVHSGGAQLSALSWGATLTLQSLVAASSESLSSPLTIDFLGKMNAVGGETLTLRNFTVVRYPAQQNP